MSVQAQYPSNLFLSEFCKRARSEACNGIEDFSVQENCVHLYTAGVNILTQPTLNEGAVTENVLVSNMLSGRKKIRVDEVVMANQQITLAPFALDSERFTVPVCNREGSIRAAPASNQQHPVRPCSTGVPTAFENSFACAPTASSAGRVAGFHSSRFIPDAYLHLQFCQQEADINQILTAHGEQLKQALEEKRHQHTRALLELIERCVLSRMKERQVEIEKIRQRNMELEDYVKKLSLESEVWMNVAQSHEALVTSLRNNLERAVAQSKEQSRGQCGQSDAKDALSCVHGESSDAGSTLRAQTVKEIKDFKDYRSCRFCRNNSISVLLLPCRHLCLCIDCDTQLGNCPVCGASKSASLQVYMD